MQQEKEFEFTREDFDYLRKLVTDTTGIIADDDKYTLYYTRLARRVRKLGLKNFTEYRNYLNANKEAELIELVNSVTTNLTAFFRENHHFEFLADSIIGKAKKRGDRKMRIWSAGCSTGEEPYSIAITLAENIPDLKSWDIKILATDIDSNVVKKASTGVYEMVRVDGMDKTRLKKYFKKGTGKNTGFVRVTDELQDMITFSQLNLLQQWPINDEMDCIFCRNVVIYFDKPTKAKLVDRFADLIKPNGYLLMGHSESLYKSSDRFQLLGKTIYQKET